jgi:arginyl-tRNA synthetase
MNGPDGRPFKTRDGKVMRLEDLIATAIDKAKVKMQHDNAAIMEADAKLINDGIAEKVAISAIKFADLQNHPNSDYIFDLDRMSSFEGKTGPYLLYQVVRIKSLLNKYNQITPTTENYTNIHLYDFERNLCLQLNHFPEILLLVIQHNSPHFLCEHLYKSAQMFSSFYASCNILAEKNERLRELRLLLCKLSLRQLEQGLELLGIETPDRM